MKNKDIEQRKKLMANAPNWLNLTQYAEPFAGVEFEYNTGNSHDKNKSAHPKAADDPVPNPRRRRNG